MYTILIRENYPPHWPDSRLMSLPAGYLRNSRDTLSHALPMPWHSTRRYHLTGSASLPWRYILYRRCRKPARSHRSDPKQTGLTFYGKKVGYTGTGISPLIVRRPIGWRRDVIHQADAVASERASLSIPAILPAPGCCILSREL